MGTGLDVKAQCMNVTVFPIEVNLNHFKLATTCIT